MRHDETRQETRRRPYESSSEDERAATKMWGASSAALAGRRRRLRATLDARHNQMHKSHRHITLYTHNLQ
jgi:hypothetical protein